MKKFLFCIGLLMLAGFTSVQAMTYEEAINQSKPMAILIYADWADNASNALQMFNTMSEQYSNKYNFVKINIATKGAKTFCKTYHIYPNMPYVILFKDRGRLTRFLQQNCVLNNACFADKLQNFGG